MRVDSMRFYKFLTSISFNMLSGFLLDKWLLQPIFLSNTLTCVIYISFKSWYRSKRLFEDPS